MGDLAALTLLLACPVPGAVPPPVAVDRALQPYRSISETFSIRKPDTEVESYIACYRTSDALHRKYAETYAPMIRQAARTLRIPSAVAHCLLFRESGQWQNRSSSTGAVGVAQVTNITLDELDAKYLAHTRTTGAASAPPSARRARYLALWKKLWAKEGKTPAVPLDRKRVAEDPRLSINLGLLWYRITYDQLYPEDAASESHLTSPMPHHLFAVGAYNRGVSGLRAECPFRNSVSDLRSCLADGQNHLDEIGRAS